MLINWALGFLHTTVRFRSVITIFYTYCEMDATCVSVLLVGCVIIFTYVWLTNSVFRYYVKFTYYYSVLFFSGFIVIPFALLRPKDIRNIRFVTALFAR